MSAFSAAFILLAAVSSPPVAYNAKVLEPPTTRPALIETPKDPNGLTLFNEKGEAVARCDKNGESFRGCKIEPGYSLDDLMNAWVHAYEDLASK